MALFVLSTAVLALSRVRHTTLAPTMPAQLAADYLQLLSEQYLHDEQAADGLQPVDPQLCTGHAVDVAVVSGPSHWWMVNQNFAVRSSPARAR